MIKNIYIFSNMDWALERNIVSIYEGTDFTLSSWWLVNLIRIKMSETPFVLQKV